MIVDLPSTTTSAIAKKLISLRNDVGAMAMGRVLTLIVSAEEASADEIVAVANDATRQHPARIIVVVRGNRRGTQRLDAQIRVGGDAGASEIVVLRLYGALADHGEAVVVPLLLPDSPIVGWWPGEPPSDVADSPIGRLAHRRITDAATAQAPRLQLKRRARHYRSGDTDLTWTRITRWRALLAASLDYPPYLPVTGATVTSQAECASADLLAGWLAYSLDVPVLRARSKDGTHLVSVRLIREDGPIDLIRTQGQVAQLSQPGNPTREVALLEPGLAQSLSAELRRLDADQVYAAALCQGLPKVSKRSMTQSEAIRAGNAPEPVEIGAKQKDRPVRSRSLMNRDPIPHSPDADRLSSLVHDKLDDARRHRVRTAPDKEQLGQQVAEAAIGELRSGVQQRGAAHLCLTGGSMGGEVVRALAQNSAGESFWSSVHLWWGDERFVPTGDPDRNDQQADDAGLLRLGVPAGAVHRLAGPSTTTTDALSELALAGEEYATQLAAAAPPVTDPDQPAVPMFDVMLLGMGPDTHVASLFPHRDEVLMTDPRQSTVPVASSPKPPPLRVSLTVPALRNSRTVHFVVAGADKAEAVSTALSADQNSPEVPASWVTGAVETTWWLDEAAAAGLPSGGA
ncbi:MAG: 6-phosphogluconolactonase [Ornithinimicrobium sp.]